ncbi:MAG: hypothetical protein ABSB70_07575 [Candidatus Velthaea sp.]|jgi:hypothetical protein
MISHRIFRPACFAFASLAFAGALCGATGAQSQPAAPASGGPACPQVAAGLSATIDTKKVKAGEMFHFATTGPVTSDGVTIPAGTNGIGLIATLDHSKSQGHSGYLVLEARYLERADGVHVPVTLLPGGDGHAASFVRAGSSSAGLIGYLPYYIGTAAGVYNTFHHGKDAAVVAGAPLQLLVGDAFYAGTCRVDIDQR